MNKKVKEITRVFYRCTKCRAVDSMKVLGEESVPMCLNCWKCKAGLGMEKTKMLNEKIGMFPVHESEVSRADKERH